MPVQAATLCIGGIVGTAAITGALVTGDSLERMVLDDSIASLGEIDVAVSSHFMFDKSLYDSISTESSVRENMDASAPVILLPCSANTPSGTTEGSVRIFGIDTLFFEMGSFYRGGERIPNLHPGTCAVNSHLADNLGIEAGDKITVRLEFPRRNDALYLTSGNSSLNFELAVSDIYETRGLGATNLESRSTRIGNIFVSREFLQDELDSPGMINLMLFSAPGGKYEGMRRADSLKNSIQKVLDDRIGYGEAGFVVRAEDEHVTLSHHDVLFDEEIVSKSGIYPHSSALLTYFVNSISSDHDVLSYSTITGIDIRNDRNFGEFLSSGVPIELKSIGKDEIVITNWTAEHLGVSEGDRIKLDYTIFDDSYRRKDSSITLTVAAMVGIEGKAADGRLMPDLPGISESVTCSAWEPPFEIDMSTVRDIDEDYWRLYEGIPKGYIDLGLARELFGNHQGDSTHLKLAAVEGGSVPQIKELLNDSFATGDAGMNVVAVKEEHIRSGDAMWVFTGMFLTFGGMVVLGGALLLMNMFLGLAACRKKEIGILRSLGESRSGIVMAYYAESAVYTIIIVVLGIAAGSGVGGGIIHALNSVWAASVESNSIPFHFELDTLAVSFAAGIAICVLSVMAPILILSKKKAVDTLRDAGGSEISGDARASRKWMLIVLFVISLFSITALWLDPGASLRATLFIIISSAFIFMAGILLGDFTGRPRLSLNIAALCVIAQIIVLSFISDNVDDRARVSFFIVSGLALLLSSLTLLWLNYRPLMGSGRMFGYMGRMALSGVRRRGRRTLFMMASISLAVFMLVALSAGEAHERRGLEDDMGSLTGGYDIRASSTVPFTGDISRYDPDRIGYTSVLTIRSVGSAGGSCSNMNAGFPPRIIGVPEAFRENCTVTFRDSRHEGSDGEIWRSLADPSPDRIPIAVDYNTLVWVYSGSLGDIFSVRGDSGEELELEVVAVMDNSIYAGMFIMSAENILKIYPQTAKLTFFLFETAGDPVDAAQNIERVFSEYGMDAAPTETLAKENLEYELSYIGIFRIFLLLGIVTGTAGVAVMVYRSARERKREIGILRSLGAGKGGILAAFLLESNLMSLPAIVIGTVVGITAAYLTLGVPQGQGLSPPFVGMLGIPVLFNLLTLAFSAIPALAASNTSPAEALRATD